MVLKCLVSLTLLSPIKLDTSQETAIGQVELNFDYSTGPVSASVGFDFGGNNAPPTGTDYDNLSKLLLPMI